MYETTLELIEKSCTGRDESGIPTITEKKTELFLTRSPKSPTRSEFWSATAAGHQLSIVLTISAWDWDEFKKPKPSELIYMDERYRIEKVYRLGEDEIELTCSEVV